MNKLGLVFLAMLLHSSAFAWEFTQLDIHERNFIFTNRYHASVEVSNVRCTRTDGYDALTLDGYRTVDNKWVFVNQDLKGENVRRANQYAPDTLPAYMNFCARVNRY